MSIDQILAEHYHRNVRRAQQHDPKTLLIKLEHVRMRHRRHSTNCTRRSHLTYAAYLRVFHHRGSIRRLNPNSMYGTLNFWPLSPCRKGDNGYPMPDSMPWKAAADHLDPQPITESAKS